MAKTAEDYADDYTDPQLRERLKEEIKASDKGGKPGQWSARKSQLLTQEYERNGGGYRGDKTDEQQSLEEWTEEDWQTADGDTRARNDDGSVDRYLPQQAWERLSEAEQAATRRRKLDSPEDRQHVANTDRAERARREATILAHYDDLTVDEVAERADGLEVAELHELLTYERDHADRSTLIDQLESLLDDARSAMVLDDYPELNADEVIDRLDGLSADELARLRDWEASHKDRSTVLEAIDRAQ